MKKNILHSYLLTTFFMLLGVASTFAQTGRYDLRLTHLSLDCATKKVVACLEIKATSTDSQFVMGSANFPISFMNNQLTNPVIKTRDNFSGGDYFSLAGVLASSTTADSSIYTVNVSYRGENGSGTTVASASWMRIGCIEFDVASTNTNSCYKLTILRKDPETVVTRALTTGLTEKVSQGAFANIANQCPANPAVALSVSGATTITAGQSATLTLTLTGGAAPATVLLSDGTSVNMTATPQNVTVTPTATKTYSITSVSGACGAGTFSNSQVQVTVNPTGGGGSGGGTTCPAICVPTSFVIKTIR